MTTSRLATAVVALLPGLVTACSADPEALPPLGHFVVHIDTDAPVLSADGDGDPTTPAPLFDRLTIDFFLPDEVEPCDECSRQIELTEETLRAGASFTARAEHGGGRLRVRGRMFRSDVLSGGEIPAASAVEVVARLPKQPAEGAVDVTLFLSTDGVGIPEGTLEAPVEIRRGRPSESRVGTWQGAARVPCASEPGEGQACVPGGAFWMGNPLVSGGGTAVADRIRLVVLAPFFVDTHELTVAELRATGLGSITGVGDWSGKLDGGSIFDLCTYSATEGVHDGFPASCVSWTAARKICQAWGGDLPTEAQLEYLSGGTASRLHVWGRDPAACGDAVFGLDAPALHAIGLLGPNDVLPCKTPDDRTPEEAFGAPFPIPADDGAAAALSRRRDRIVLGGRTVWDVAGDLQEWALDRFQSQDEPCWNGSRGNILHDPLCDEPGAVGEEHTLRGGMWGSTGAELRAAARTHSEDKGGPPVGFRCVRPGS